MDFDAFGLLTIGGKKELMIFIKIHFLRLGLQSVKKKHLINNYRLFRCGLPLAVYQNDF